MAIKTLLDGQDIRIDNHHRGKEVKYKRLHIDKTMTNDCKKFLAGARITINIDGSVKWTQRGRNLKSNDKLESELKKTFGKIEDRILKEFVEDVLEKVHLFNTEKMSAEELIKNIIKGIYEDVNLDIKISEDSKNKNRYNVYVVEYEVFYRGKINQKSITIEDRTTPRDSCE